MKRRIFRRDPLATRFLIAILSFSSLIALAATALQLKSDYSYMIHDVRSTFSKIVSGHLLPLQSAVWDFNEKKINAHLNELIQLHGIINVNIAVAGKVKWSAGESVEGVIMHASFSLKHLHRAEQMDIGILHVNGNLDVIYDRLIDKAFLILLSNGIKTLLVGLFVYFIFYKWVGRHLDRMADVVGNLNPDSLGETLTLKRKQNSPGKEDDLDQLVNAFNRMQDNLKSSYAAVADSEGKFRSIFENAAEGFFQSTIDGTLITVNPAMARILGYDSPQDLMNNAINIHQQFFVDPSERDACRAKQDSTGTLLGEDIQWYRKDGTVVWVSMSSRLVRDRAGNPLRVEGNVQDIHERKSAESQLLVAQKMEAVGQLTGGIAHDFNNILGIIQGNFEILQRMLAGDEKALRRIETGLKGAARGADLTRKLLNFSSKDAGGAKRISVNTFIHDMEDLLAKSLTVSIKVNFHLDDDLWLVDVDPGDLQDVLINLALNARDAMSEGGHLVIETHNKVLDENYSRLNPQGEAGEFVMLSVSDTGHGMSAEVKDRVLEPFFTTKGKDKGTGLGLSMVYGFVQRSGGHIKICSEVGKGTTFRLYLPRAKEQISQIAAHKDEIISLPVGSETVLVVDDEKDLQNIAVFHLEDLGYNAIIVENGKQALEILRDSRDIDLLFSDVVMPGGLDGYQLALAARAQHPELKVLLTSGFTKKTAEFKNNDDNYLVKLNKDLLSKPYNQAELSIAVRGIIDEAG